MLKESRRDRKKKNDRQRQRNGECVQVIGILGYNISNHTHLTTYKEKKNTYKESIYLPPVWGERRASSSPPSASHSTAQEAKQRVQDRINRAGGFNLFTPAEVTTPEIRHGREAERLRWRGKRAKVSAAWGEMRQMREKIRVGPASGRCWLSPGYRLPKSPWLERCGWLGYCAWGRAVYHIERVCVGICARGCVCVFKWLCLRVYVYILICTIQTHTAKFCPSCPQFT